MKKLTSSQSNKLATEYVVPFGERLDFVLELLSKGYSISSIVTSCTKNGVIYKNANGILKYADVVESSYLGLNLPLGYRVVSNKKLESIFGNSIVFYPEDDTHMMKGYCRDNNIQFPGLSIPLQLYKEDEEVQKFLDILLCDISQVVYSDYGKLKPLLQYDAKSDCLLIKGIPYNSNGRYEVVCYTKAFELDHVFKFDDPLEAIKQWAYDNMRVPLMSSISCCSKDEVDLLRAFVDRGKSIEYLWLGIPQKFDFMIDVCKERLARCSDVKEKSYPDVVYPFDMA